MNMARVVEKYWVGTSAMGGICKMFETWDAKLDRKMENRHENKTSYQMRDMLMGEKVGVCIWATVMGPVFMPLKVLQAMNHVDMYFKGEKPTDHGYMTKRHISDYMNP
jgi:hypothetical protein